MLSLLTSKAHSGVTGAAPSAVKVGFIKADLYHAGKPSQYIRVIGHIRARDAATRKILIEGLKEVIDRHLPSNSSAEISLVDVRPEVILCYFFTVLC